MQRIALSGSRWYVNKTKKKYTKAYMYIHHILPHVIVFLLQAATALQCPTVRQSNRLVTSVLKQTALPVKHGAPTLRSCALLTDTCSCDSITCDETFDFENTILPNYLLVSTVSVTIPANTNDIVRIDVLEQEITAEAHDVIALSVPADSPLPVSCRSNEEPSSFQNILLFDGLDCSSKSK